MKLKALVHLQSRPMDGPGELVGHNAEGEPIYRYPMVEHEVGSIFEIEDEYAERLLRNKYATADLDHEVLYRE